MAVVQGRAAFPFPVLPNVKVLLMGNVRFGLPLDLTNSIQERAGIRVAVETGTYLGGSTRLLAKLFKQVWTIEASIELLWHAQAELNILGIDNVEFVCGDSANRLGNVLTRIEEPALFWLDSHWFPKLAMSDKRQCPLLDELSVIAEWAQVEQSWILVDDVYLFRRLPSLQGYRTTEWPSLDDINEILRKSFLGHAVREIEGVLVLEPRSAAGIREET